MKKTNEAALKTKQIMDRIDNTLEQFTKYLKSVFKKFFKDLKNVDGEINFVFLFQVLIKLVLLFLGFMLLKIPFDMARELGDFLFRFFIPPFNLLFIFSWKMLSIVFYFIICFSLFIFVFQKYFKTKKKFLCFSNIIRLFISILVFFPAWCLNFTFLCFILFLIYLFMNGIYFIGLFFILIGSSLLLGFAVECIKKLFSKDIKISIIPFFINLGILVIGCLIFVKDLSKYQYYKTLEDSALEQNYTYEMEIQQNIDIEAPNGTKEFIVDNNIPDNQVKINITYYDSYNIHEEEERIIVYRDHTRSKKEIFKLFLQDLKNKKIYNYNMFNHCDIKIYVNEKTKDFIK